MRDRADVAAADEARGRQERVAVRVQAARRGRATAKRGGRVRAVVRA